MPHRNIAIDVKTKFELDISNEKNQDFFFFYQITITNKGHFPVQILYRQWHIMDFVLGIRKVEGEGVVGEKPVIPPQQKYEYSSFCFLRYPIGYMKGKYTAINTLTQESIEIPIPHFLLCMPHLLN